MAGSKVNVNKSVEIGKKQMVLTKLHYQMDFKQQ